MKLTVNRTIAVGDPGWGARSDLFMMLLDAIVIAAVTVALALGAAVFFIVSSLAHAAPLIAARVGRSRIDVVVVRTGSRTWRARPQPASRPTSSLAPGFGHALQSEPRN
jgi:hypothetical protein